MRTKINLKQTTSAFLLAAILAPYAAHAISPEAAAHADLQNSVEGQAMLRFAKVRMQTRFYAMSTMAQSRFVAKTEKLLTKIERKLEKQTPAEYEARFEALTEKVTNREVAMPEELDAEYQGSLRSLGIVDELTTLQPKVQKTIAYVQQETMLDQVRESLVKLHQYQHAQVSGQKLSRAPAMQADDILFPIVLFLPILLSITLGIVFGWAFLVILGVAVGAEVLYLAIGGIVLAAGGI